MTQPLRKFTTQRRVDTLSWTIDAKPKAITQFVKSISEVLGRRSDVSPDIAINVGIVLAEVLNNIAEHAFSDSAQGVIAVQAIIADDAISFKTRDCGAPMPGLQPPDPVEPDHCVTLNDLPEGGFGWYMIRQLCTGLTYQRVRGENRLGFELSL